MDHQAAHHDVVRGVRRVEGLGDPLREGAVGKAGEPACAGDDLSGAIHSQDGAARGDRFGHHAGEGAGAASDVENLVAWADAAEGGQPGEDAASAAAEEDVVEHVIASSVPYVHAGRAGISL
jgi:hypothetical protein